LLQEGFARCADWSMKNVTHGVDKLRAAERFVHHVTNIGIRKEDFVSFIDKTIVVETRYRDLK
jgi:hypothetical protein